MKDSILYSCVWGTHFDRAHVLASYFPTPLQDSTPTQTERDVIQSLGTIFSLPGSFPRQLRKYPKFLH